MSFLLPLAWLTCSSFTLAIEKQPVDVLLVTSADLEKAWQPFVDWKAKGGKSVKVVSTTSIAKSFEGPDLQEKIRQCVRQHIDTEGTRWVILGGDSQPDGKGVVPDRDTVHENMWGKKTDIPTDIYYISPGNWDADGDGVYGEFKDDREAIAYPDGRVGLGRIPVRSVADVKAYTEKVVSYESKYPKGDFSNTMIYTCTVPGAYAKVRRSWDDHLSKIFPDGKMSRYFAHQTPWDKDRPGDFQLNCKNWIEMINRGTVGKFHFHGHGLIEGWVLEGHEMFTAKQVDKLKNKDAYPVITTVSCFTGHYDAKKDPSIAESMLRVPDAGAIAIVAPCREGKPHFADPKRDFPLMMKEGKMDGTTGTMTYFWELGIKAELTAGEALMKTKARMAEQAKASANWHMCLVELNLLGDPTIMVHPAARK